MLIEAPSGSTTFIDDFEVLMGPMSAASSEFLLYISISRVLSGRWGMQNLSES